MYKLFDKIYNKHYNFLIFIIILCFTTIVYTIDMTASDGNKCLKKIKKTKDKIFYSLLILLHHFIVYLVFGGVFFTNKKLLSVILLIAIIIPTHWMFFNNRCSLTIIGSKYCDHEESHHFNDVFKLMGLKKFDVFNNIIYVAFYYIIMSVYVYRLYKLKK